MEYEKLLELIKTVSESNITGLHYETGDTKIVISTVESGLAGTGVQSGGGARAEFAAGRVPSCGAVSGQAYEGADMMQSSVQGAGNAAVASVLSVGNIVKSPLVGTFYTAPAEDAAPFVNVGDHVKIGQTMAIVEAMKLMNEIESEYEGTVTQVFVKNGDCVEYGQPLFAIG